MRIISGNLKGRTLCRPEDGATRPLKDLVRESIFNLLIHTNKISFKIEESNILDLYAGAGSFGLECLSRSAKSVCFVENKETTINILKKNIDKLDLKKKTKVFFEDVFKLIIKKNFMVTKFNLIFCDPPYKFVNIEKLLQAIHDNNLLCENGIIILHRNKSTKETLPNFFRIIDKRIYGLSKIVFGKF